MRICNRLISSILLMLILVVGGCSDFLERKPLGSAIQGDLDNVGGVEAETFGLYGLLRTSSITELNFVFMHSIRSDDAVKGYIESNTAAYEGMGDRFEYNSGDTWLLPGYWDSHYSVIGQCNDILYEIESLNLTDDATKVNQAEAQFFRAYAYFDLVRTFGEVPKIDFKIVNIGDANVAKSTVDEIYELIDSDLEFASTFLPISWSSKYAGRLTSGTAHALWAKAKLYRQQWASALSECEVVINSGLYSLYPSYADLFQEKGENSGESLFEVQNYTNSNGSIWLNNDLVTRTGIRGDGYFDQGWGWNQPSEALVNAYEEGDPRKEATILFRGESDGFGRMLPDNLQLLYWNKKVYSEPDRLQETGHKQPGYLNTRLLRYADVLLMAAEAANELGESNKALGYLNQVRERARDGQDVLPDITITNIDDLRIAVKHERRIELAMEYDRFFDLVRWGDALTVLGPSGYTNRCRYYPIPVLAIDRSQGIIVQNPEW